MRSFLTYVLIVTLFCGAIWLVIGFGKRLPPAAGAAPTRNTQSGDTPLRTLLLHRATGMGWRDSLSLGALMNTRGLMELIALNIGYDLGVLTPAMFAIMVVMALVTTMATGPLLTLIGRMRVPDGHSEWSNQMA